MREIQRGWQILEAEVLAISRKVSSGALVCWCATRETSGGHASRRIVPSGEGSRRGPLCIPTNHPEHNFSRQDFALVMSAPRRNTVSRANFPSRFRVSSPKRYATETMPPRKWFADPTSVHASAIPPERDSVINQWPGSMPRRLECILC